MKTRIIPILILSVILFSSCGGSQESPASGESGTEAAAPANADPRQNKGTGPVSEVVLAAEIDQTMAQEGKKIYDNMCTACHKPTEKFIGPAPQGILERRSPEWVMNMILNPVEMVQKDPDAKKLLMEYNGAPMANQNLTEDQARAVLEYFRTL